MRTLTPERRQVILTTAAKLFLEKGFFATTMSDVARAVVCSKATLYNYFPSKDLLIEAIFVHHMSEVLRRAAEELDDAERPVRERLERFVEQMLRLRFDTQIQPFYHLVVASAGRAPHLAQSFLKAGPGELNERTAQLFAELMAQGVFRKADPMRRARQLQMLIMVENNYWSLNPDLPKPDDALFRQLALEVTDFFWEGAVAR